MKKKVLIVDDNSTSQYMLEILLKGYGLEVTSAENGKDALDKARLNPPDLILTDILMPVMDGYALCREWKSDDTLKHIPLVFYTSTYTEPKDEEFALSLGAERVIIKPQEPDILMNMLKEVLEEKYTARQAVTKPLGEEMEFFRQHSEILFKKLEKKMIDLEIANQKLTISEQRYRLSFENATDVSYAIDNDLNVLTVSPSVERILGYKPQDFIGRPVSDLGYILTQESFEQIIADISLVLKGEIIPAAIYRFIAKDGTIKYGEVSGSPLMREGKIIGTISIARDITDRKEAEDKAKKYSAELTEKNEELRAMTQQLWQAAKLATMGELSASIAHELNNPLATVGMRAESLLTKTQQDSPMWRELKIIEQEVERMGNLVANLLQFSRRGQQQISTVDICEEIEKSLELIYYHLRKNNIVIRREFAKEVPRIHADRQQLRQLFLNLFTNASDAMPQGGTLTIRVTTPPESKQVIIEVADTGTGISPEILPKVAEPFYTTKPEGKGTGLGLAICRRIMQEHKGTFDLVSEGISGKGTTARISFPVTNVTNAARKINDRSNR
jgi:PAS domain S-box-containing protein